MSEREQEGQERGAAEQAQEEGVGVRRTRDITITFSEHAYRELEALARRKGQDIARYIQSAIELQKWYDETQDQGGHILVERGGQVRAVVRDS